MRKGNLDKYRKYQNSYRKANRNRYAEKDRWRAIKKAYNLTKEDYDLFMEKQNGVCAICSSPPIISIYSGIRKGTPFTATRTMLNVDHDHQTGKIRGLLCPNCNKGLGWYEKHYNNAKRYLDS